MFLPESGSEGREEMRKLLESLYNVISIEHTDLESRIDTIFHQIDVTIRETDVAPRCRSSEIYERSQLKKLNYNLSRHRYMKNPHIIRSPMYLETFPLTFQGSSTNVISPNLCSSSLSNTQSNRFCLFLS